MFRKTILFTLAVSGAASMAMAQTAPAQLNDAERAMKSHVMFLASDAMRGRDAGSPEYDIAAQYVASQFYAAGLKPAGDNGSYLQTVPLIWYQPEGEGKFTLEMGGKTTQLTYGKDYVPFGSPATDHLIRSGKLVFVGQGIDAPDYKHNDYAGVDVKGKIVMIVPGAPKNFDGEERAHFGSIKNKAVEAAKRGAVGVIMLVPPSAPMERMKAYAEHRQMTWTDKDGNGFVDGAPILGILGGDASRMLLSSAGLTEDGMKAAISGGTFKPVAFNATLTTDVESKRERLKSSNVAGILPGSDPKVGDQVVVLSAHLDHVGVGKPDKTGDTIYNGAMDNAVGVASLIEEAKRFQKSGVPPKRSILFLAVTGEEKGLVGSDYFARHPTVPKENLVADVNLDMPIITYKFQDVIAFGAARSTLGPIVKKAAAQAGAKFSPDPMPDQGLFVRSDHYRFVQQGIPSVFLWPGEAGDGKAATEEFFKEHYHKPSDQLDQKRPIDWSSGVRFIDVNYQIARDIADADKRPAWNKGDFFGVLYNGYGAK